MRKMGVQYLWRNAILDWRFAKLALECLAIGG